MAAWNDHGLFCHCISCSDMGKPAGWDEMNDLMGRIKFVNGHVPKGISKVLELISQKEIIEWTWNWLEHAYMGIDGEEGENNGKSS